MFDFTNFIREKKRIVCIGIILLVLISLAAIFDKALGVGLLLTVFLAAGTFFVFFRSGIKDKTLFRLFLVGLLVYVSAAIFFHYTGFQPFGGGVTDSTTYHSQAQKIAHGLQEGKISFNEIIFNFQKLEVITYYPVIIGFIYLLTLPEMIIGNLFCAWLAAISIVCVYLIVLEIGGSKKGASFAGLIALVYPSYLFYGSFLLRDTIIVPSAMLGLLLMIKLIKNFSWKNFGFLYLFLLLLTNLKFYIAYPLLFTFIICWLAFSKMNWRERFSHGIILIYLLGLIPQIAAGQGYYGIDSFKLYLNQNKITFYREVAYVAAPTSSQEQPPITQDIPAQVSNSQLPTVQLPVTQSYSPQSATEPPSQDNTRLFVYGGDSTYVIDTNFDNPLKFIKNYLKSFIIAILGPFPWQMKYPRHFFALLETIPWYFLLFFIIRGILRIIKPQYRVVLPLVFFSLLLFGAFALFISNFGILTRIRIPAFLSLICFIPFGFKMDKFNKGVRSNKINRIKILWKKLFA